jgi:hypothetical protein
MNASDIIGMKRRSPVLARVCDERLPDSVRPKRADIGLGTMNCILCRRPCSFLRGVVSNRQRLRPTQSSVPGLREESVDDRLCVGTIIIKADWRIFPKIDNPFAPFGENGFA